MTHTSTQPLTLDQFATRYSDNPRYELADQELIDIEPTGPHETESYRFWSIERVN